MPWAEKYAVLLQALFEPIKLMLNQSKSSVMSENAGET